MGLPFRRHRRSPTEPEQKAHLAERFGLHLRHDFGPLAHRYRAPQSLWNALATPYYELLHNGNVVPREAVAQRGRLSGSIALNVGRYGQAAQSATARAQLFARVLMAQYDAHAAVYDIQPLEWDPATADGVFAIEVATGRGTGDALVTVRDGDLTAVLEALLEAVRPQGAMLVVSRDPVDLRDDPASSWRWIHPITPPMRAGEFDELHRRMAFDVLSAMVLTPEQSGRPLKSVPPGYLDVPGLGPGEGLGS